MPDSIIDPIRWLAIFDEAAAAVAEAVHAMPDRLGLGERPGQYALDVVADEVALRVLHASGARVLSEESGLTGDHGPLVVLDPVDGSTNCSHGIPYWATSLCLFDDEGPVVALVVNVANGERFRAVRGAGATLDGEPIEPTGQTELADAIVGLSGWPGVEAGWRQFRALGASALDLCNVAAGRFDAFADASAEHGIWDYAGAVLVCEEAGARVGERNGDELIVLDPDVTRGPMAAATDELFDELVAALGPA